MRALYARLESGEAANLDDVDAEIHFALEGPVKTSGGNFGSSSLKTWASRTTRVRTQGQLAYLDLMRTHPLVFGNGSAGTGKPIFRRRLRRAHLLYELRRVERL